VQGAVDGEGAAPASTKQEGGPEAVLKPAPATAVAGKACEAAAVSSEAGAEHPSSGIEVTPEAGVGGEVGDRNSQERQAGDAGQKHEGSREPSGPSPSPKVWTSWRVDELPCAYHDTPRVIEGPAFSEVRQLSARPEVIQES